MRQSTYMAEQDRDGIMICIPGSNTVYVDFDTQADAELFNDEELGGKGRVVRNGRAKDMSDEDMEMDYDMRRMRRIARLKRDPDFPDNCPYCDIEH